MDLTGFAPIGRIVTTHGLSGEVSVAATANLPLERLIGLEVWFVPPRDRLRTSRIAAVRPGPKGPLVTLEGVDDLNTAAALRGSTLSVLAASLPKDLVDEAPSPDPVGLRVTDVERGELGEVRDVIVTGANDVWIVDGGRFGEVLLPVIDAVLLAVDWDERTASVRLLPGLIEDE